MSDIPAVIAKQLGLNQRNVESTISLLEEGATIPFISRYRKECTGSLNEVDIRDIDILYRKLKELDKRKEYIIDVIEKSGALTDDLRAKILNNWDATEIEDLYMPYKPKRRTRASMAKEKGLEPLARIIMAMNSRDLHTTAQRFVNDKVESEQDAFDGACDIIAEWISENVRYRAWLRNNVVKRGVVISSIARGKNQEADNYLNYGNFRRDINKCSSHHILALRRGEKEGMLKLCIEIDDEEALRHGKNIFVHKKCSQENVDLIKKSLEDSYDRLIMPSIENEAWKLWKEGADKEAINLFSENLRQLLMGAPLGKKRVMGIDPGIRTGCKVVCLDEQGNLLHNDVIYPQRERSTSALKISNLVEEYRIDAIALGNGTGSRETEQFLNVLHFPHKVRIVVVNESGASVYSASDIAREEFPDKDVTVRGAVSIGRRLLDPLAELVKIDPKSIGVGQYQHDVDQGLLKDSLDFTVMSCVNQVGVNVNTASKQLLSYISGIGPALAENIVNHRSLHGEYKSREDLKKVPRMGEKTFVQCAGFLRIPDSENPLDNTAVHPESYYIVQKIADDLGVSVSKLVGDGRLMDSVPLARYVTDKVGLPTLQDIADEIKRPGRDPRALFEDFSFDPNVTEIEHLEIGMVLPGIINNITAFGAFVDIGLHESGLVHVSQISDKFVKDPSAVLKMHQHVRVKVIEVDYRRKRISLSMKGVEQ